MITFGLPAHKRQQLLRVPRVLGRVVQQRVQGAPARRGGGGGGGRLCARPSEGTGYACHTLASMGRGLGTGAGGRMQPWREWPVQASLPYRRACPCPWLTVPILLLSCCAAGGRAHLGQYSSTRYMLPSCWHRPLHVGTDERRQGGEGSRRHRPSEAAEAGREVTPASTGRSPGNCRAHACKHEWTSTFAKWRVSQGGSTEAGPLSNISPEGNNVVVAAGLQVHLHLQAAGRAGRAGRARRVGHTQQMFAQPWAAQVARAVRGATKLAALPTSQ